MTPSSIQELIAQQQSIVENIPANQLAKRMEQDKEAARQLMRDPVGRVEYYEQHSKVANDKREREEKERLEDMAFKQESLDVQKDQLKESKRSNILSGLQYVATIIGIVIGALVGAAGMLVTLLLSETFRSWIFN